MTEFIIDSRLSNDYVFISELNLCRLLLSRNSLYPWVILVPRRDNLHEIIDLSREDQLTLMLEISLVSKVMKNIFKPDKINVAALGNIVPQLHIHIIARYSSDSAWPNAPFRKAKAKYEDNKLTEMINQIRNSLEKYNA